MTLTTQIIVSVKAEQTEPADLEAVASRLDRAYVLELANGTGAGQADLLFSDRRVLAATTAESLDLVGSLVNVFKSVLSYARIKALLIFSAATNPADLEVGGAAANAFLSPFGAANDVVKVRPGGVLLLVAPDAAGYVVTAGTADLLKVNNAGAAPATYDVVVVGASA